MSSTNQQVPPKTSAEMFTLHVFRNDTQIGQTMCRRIEIVNGPGRDLTSYNCNAFPPFRIRRGDGLDSHRIYCDSLLLPLHGSDGVTLPRDIALGLPKYRMVPARSRADVDLPIRIRELLATFGVTGLGLLVAHSHRCAFALALVDHICMDRYIQSTHRCLRPPVRALTPVCLPMTDST